MASTDSRGPTRLSGAILLKKNLLDPVIYVPACTTYLFCLAVGRHWSLLSFLSLFIGITWIIQRHVESYRAFSVTRKWTHALESDPTFVDAFLAKNFRTHPKPSRATLQQTDTYVWLNKIINYFWPYLSHVVHHELNDFLAHSGSMARSKKGLKRYLYALVRQLDANILAIEHCELGARAPFIKSLLVFDEGAHRKSVVCDLDLAYEGNMNMSFICRYCCCCSSRVGFKDVFVHLRSRLVIGPIDDTKPSVEAISFSLLELPQFGYKGIALVELTELKLARRSINRLIKDHLLYPKQIRLTEAELKQKMGEQAKASGPTSAKQAEGADSPAVLNPKSPSPPSNGPPPTFTARLLARLTYFAFICSNGCLRCCCQQERVAAAERQQS